MKPLNLYNLTKKELIKLLEGDYNYLYRRIDRLEKKVENHNTNLCFLLDQRELLAADMIRMEKDYKEEIGHLQKEVFELREWVSRLSYRLNSMEHDPK